MKTLLTLFVLFFSSSVFADDISDFEIEGMSIGDSLLDYFNEEEIKKNTGFSAYDYKKDKTFVLAVFSKTLLNKHYDMIQVHYKRNDKKRIIYAINGMNFYQNNIDDCYDEKDKIVEEISLMFVNAEKRNNSGKHSADVSGKSNVVQTAFVFVSGDYVNVSCYDWSNEMSYADKLVVGIVKKELNTWLSSN